MNTATTDPIDVQLTRTRVKKGVAWLDEHAPFYWRFNLVHFSNGRVVSLVRTLRNEENALALAFKREAAYRDGRYVTLWSVSDRFNLDHNALKTLGFLENNTRDAELLDMAWQEALNNYKQPILYPHYPSH